MYNGPKCGASAPDHAHFQACSKNEVMHGVFYDTDNDNAYSELIDNDQVNIISVNFPVCSINIRANNKKTMSETFYQIYDILAANSNGKEPMMNILAWYGPERIKAAL